MNYLNACPPFDSQYSVATHTDAEDCVSESLCHLVYMLTHRRYSPRALANLSHTSHVGNRVDAVLAAANAYGLIPYEAWPTPDLFTWETYYSPIPQEVMAKAEKIDISLVPFDLNVSPGWTELEYGSGSTVVAHMVAQINPDQYFDSETGAPIKPINGGTLNGVYYPQPKVIYQTSILINKPPMNQDVQILNYNGEVGVFIPLASEDPHEISVFNRTYNINIVPQPDGTIPQAKPVTDKV